jgi:uncharacterized protein DUF4326
MTTTVVRLKRHKGQVIQDCDVYIGRKITMGGWNLSASMWANPYKVGTDGELDEVLCHYESYIRKKLHKPKYQEALSTLRGKRLGCWCHPKPCHGDILVKILNEADPYNSKESLAKA